MNKSETLKDKRRVTMKYLQQTLNKLLTSQVYPGRRCLKGLGVGRSAAFFMFTELLGFSYVHTKMLKGQFRNHNRHYRCRAGISQKNIFC